MPEANISFLLSINCFTAHTDVNTLDPLRFKQPYYNGIDI